MYIFIDYIMTLVSYSSENLVNSPVAIFSYAPYYAPCNSLMN